ncbi:LCP family protein [Brevibacterium linens]|uniref:Transcriptional attenuator, LytR family n=1 Tax=Brevibacterium linens TaxID=1703 RepID=A0A2H1K5A0_BRELN|nr:LCP family protein [Brevibacterium linens]SMX94975.1 transcriptional attenuator, LytR family [Brevibacterium linens]
MAKLKKMVSAVGSVKDLNSARAEFDDASRILPDEAIFPPEDIRPGSTDARTLLLRITHPGLTQETTSQGDTFTIIHIPATNDFAAVMTLNPSAQIESGLTFASIADEGGLQVIVAMVEDILGVRIDHVAELESAALGQVITELGGLPVYSRAAFPAGGTDFIEGTNHLTADTAGTFTTADPIDDAGQTRTRNQRAALRALIQALKTGGLAKDPNKGATVLGHFASGIHHDAGLTTLELGKIANSVRQLESDDIAVVTIPTTSRRTDDGTVIIDFDAEAMPALKDALTGKDLPDFFRYLVSLGY